jgi:hypothetical protein
MDWHIALILLIGMGLFVCALSIAVNIYLFLGIFFPNLNLETERKLRMLFKGKPSPIIINPGSYVRERNVRMIFRVGWVTFLSAVLLALIPLLWRF